jgi:hypothetical protein
MVGMMSFLKLLAGFFSSSMKNDLWPSWMITHQFGSIVDIVLDDNPNIIFIVMLGNLFPSVVRVLLYQRLTSFH